MNMPLDMKAHQIYVCANALETLVTKSDLAGELRERLLALTAIMSRDAETLCDELDPCNLEGAMNAYFPDVVKELRIACSVTEPTASSADGASGSAEVVFTGNILPFRR